MRCLEVRDTSDLDRLLWCGSCRSRARKRANRFGWTVGSAVAAALALAIWFGLRPSLDLIPGGWLATLVAALWIASRIVREVVYGMMRFQNRKAVDAAPPAAPPT